NNGGIFLNVIYSKEWLSKLKVTDNYFNKYSIDEIKTLTKCSGLEIIDIIEIDKEKAFGIISKKK
ncbi:MAG: hypothetical protein LBM96_10305, partial [Methanobrevibacter sp.]|nr:hypothetical protein [Candidatus Methanoflexus mossambicus]